MSQVVTVFLMIVLVLVAVGIVWGVVKNLINESVEEISVGINTIDLKINSVVLGNDNNISMIVKRESGKGELTNLKFIFYNGENTESCTVDCDLSELEIGSYECTLSDLNVNIIDKIEVALLFVSDSGKEYLTEPVAEKVIKSSAVVCGDDSCDSFENCSSCPADCGCGVGEICSSEGVCRIECSSGHTDNGDGTCSVTLSPVEDAFVDLGSPNDNLGSLTFLFIGNSAKMSFLKFDVSDIPSESTIESAFYKNFVSFSSINNLGVGIYPCVGSWDEMSVTWNTKPSIGSEIISDSSTNYVSTSIGHWRLHNISPLVQEWVDGTTTNNGIAFYYTGSSYARVYSREYSTTTNRPYLDVTYS